MIKSVKYFSCVCNSLTDASHFLLMAFYCSREDDIVADSDTRGKRSFVDTMKTTSGSMRLKFNMGKCL